MAISNIPKIKGSDYGGVIYGLNLNVGYSTEPSKLTIDIVNEKGTYILPTLNTASSVEFGNFKFNGIIWSYNLRETAGEKTLQITLIDNSVILDRYYVLLWKRGLLGQIGKLQSKSKIFDFSDESILVPVYKNSKITFEEKTLGSITKKSNSYELNDGAVKINNLILAGREKFANSECDIPDTYYTFNDLKAKIPVNMDNPPNNNTWRSTHEGTLREVLSSWCSDIGYDYYWNYATNRLAFYDVSRGITTVPNVTASNIISKEFSSSMEGTFKHYGIGWTAMPKSPVKALTGSKSFVILTQLNPYPISYFINKLGVAQDIDVDRGSWGGSRGQDGFVQAAFLGFVARSLRDLYCFKNEHWEALGYTVGSGIKTDKAKIMNALKKFGYQDVITDLEAFDAKDLPNYNFDFINRDPTLADKWNELEQELLQYYGKYYRSADSSGSFFYCNSVYTMEIEISVEPEGQQFESNNLDFSGRKIIDRGGTMSHDSTSAQDALGYGDLTNDIQNCAPIHIDLKESGLLDSFKTAKLLSGNDKINTLVIYPNNGTFVKGKIGFDSSLTRTINNLEQTIDDIKKANINNNRKNCAAYDTTLQQNSCQSLEEIAHNQAIIKAGGSVNSQESPDNYVSGLIQKRARACKIKLKGGSVTICAPSDSQLQCVHRYNITANKISFLNTPQKIFSDGSVGSADNVAEIRVSNDNITDPDQDFYQSKRNGALIRAADSESSTPQQQAKYTFAGEPTNVTLSPSNGLSSLDISLSSEGFTTTAVFSSKPKKPSKVNNMVRYVQSQFNRASYNAS